MDEPTKEEIQEVFKRLMLHRVLDSWTWDQLRNMKVGGNLAAQEFFRRTPGLADNKDAKTKYTSKTAELYKAKLAQKAKEDAIAHPGKVVVDHHSEDPTIKSSAATTPSIADDNDFFNTWNQPKSKPTTPRTPLTPSAPPVIGLGMGMATSKTGSSNSLQSIGSNEALPGLNTTVAQTTTTTTTSRTAISRPTKSTLVGARKTGQAAKPMKLGAKRAEGVSFEEAERRAKAEAERIAQIGAEAAEEERRRKQEAEEAARQRSLQSNQSGARGGDQNGANTWTNYYQANTADKGSRVSSEEMERLGMGMGRMGFGSVGGGNGSSTRSNSTRAAPEVEDNTTSARERFGNQKAISSDQYFGRNNYDAEQQAEATARLQAFSGATSISSNQYFGRPEESPPLVNSDVSLASLSNLSAADIARKLGQADLSTIKNAVQTGAGKLGGLLQEMQAKYSQY
ncbi:ADP-ribosylation factor GTPase activating protein, ER-Golgi transport [Actinomortierella wolfii]|nr:ADP-ribosylation factor GTPase activating protein, ER-Golgi transport [Actinomortierella wolfii]